MSGNDRATLLIEQNLPSDIPQDFVASMTSNDSKAAKSCLFLVVATHPIY
jgi:hypothetical protein